MNTVYHKETCLLILQATKTLQYAATRYLFQPRCIGFNQGGSYFLEFVHICLHAVVKIIRLVTIIAVFP